ncbi:MAG: valine--tRNA ligase [Candidatus Curtissbacteria bacterium]|nr:valine--tRNA ligase [Candidatus Curtissbacteria bacterium]
MKTIKNNFKNEKEIYDFWEKKKYFSADPTSSKKSFSLLIPPPNLTGELHLGHVMQHSILDAIARFKRFQGFDVLLLPGVDHAGIQFEATFEKKLQKDDLSKQKLGREKWLEKAWEFKEEIYKSVWRSWRMMGLSADWKREVFTLDDGPRQAVFEEFKTFYDKGLIYKGPYIVQWCPKDRTAIENAEVEYEERKEKLYFVKYLVEGTKNEYIEIATTRPETIFADTAIAIYPGHPKYKKYVGKKALTPISILSLSGPRSIPIIEDSRVEKELGTGALKITPGHDLLDYAIGKDHDLEVLQVIGKDGKTTMLAAPLFDLKVDEARQQVLLELRKNGSLVKEEDYKHSVAVCERCRSVVEPLISEEWFVKVGNLAKEAIKTIKANEIRFLPKNYAKILSGWLENIHDWCISRSLWWGHRIPVWYRGDEIKVSLDSPGEDWVQDEQVLDTWFSSGLWPMSTLGWPSFAKASDGKPHDQKAGFDPELVKYYPWDFEISAPEIKFLWIARMIMLSVHFTDQIPFKTMFFHGMLRDLEGRKFSKSLGNGIEPMYLIEKWGVDATRMALYTYSVPGRDGRVSKAILDERGKNYRNFGTKLRNVTKFILELKPANSKQTKNLSHEEDALIEKELQDLIKAVTKHLDNLELHLAVEALYEFTWHKFADIYIEKSKARREEAQPILEHILKQLLIMLHPFMPFVTEEIYQKFDVKKESIMLEEWPA